MFSVVFQYQILLMFSVVFQYHILLLFSVVLQYILLNSLSNFADVAYRQIQWRDKGNLSITDSFFVFV